MNKLKKILPLITLSCLMCAAAIYIDFNTVIKFKALIIELAKNNLIFSSFIYITIYTICVALSLPIATMLTLLAGIIFGPTLGTLIVVTGATLGATIIFYIIKNATNNLNIINKYKKSKPLLTLQNNLQKNATSYLLFARLVPIFPFVLINIGAGLANIKISTFIYTTFIGIIPGSFIYTYLGYQTGQINNIAGLISPKMIFALCLLGVFSLTPVLIKRIKKHD